MQNAHQAEVETHIAVEDMTEFMGDDPLQFVAGQKVHASARNADNGVARRKTGGESVDAVFIQQIDPRRRQPGSDGHFFHDIQQSPFGRSGSLRVDRLCAEHAGNRLAAR